jgi:hypothetical protein
MAVPVLVESGNVRVMRTNGCGGNTQEKAVGGEKRPHDTIPVS